jgi:hypothetical protein
MSLKSPPQFLWLFQTCQLHSRSSDQSIDVAQAMDSLYDSEWAHPESPAGRVLRSPFIYSEVCKFIFGCDPGPNPIDFLQTHSYFKRGDPSLLDSHVAFAIPEYLALTECLMWAYLDKKLPCDQLRTVLTRSIDSESPDAESLLCQWINRIALKHGHLTPLKCISRKFLGQAHLPCFFYHITLNDSLLAQPNWLLRTRRRVTQPLFLRLLESMESSCRSTSRKLRNLRSIFSVFFVRQLLF